MVTTFVCLAGSHTKGVWRLIEKASQEDIRLAEMAHPSLEKTLTFCSGRVPIYVPPSFFFYRSLKLRYPLNIGGMSRHS